MTTIPTANEVRENATAIPKATEVLIRCWCARTDRRPREIEQFLEEDGLWKGVCGVLAPAVSSLGPALYERTADESLPARRDSRLFYRTRDELPRWRGRCQSCRGARDGRRGQVDLPGAALVHLLDQAAAVWLLKIDLYDLANNDGRNTAARLARRRADLALG